MNVRTAALLFLLRQDFMDFMLFLKIYEIKSIRFVCALVFFGIYDLLVGGMFDGKLLACSFVLKMNTKSPFSIFLYCHW